MALCKHRMEEEWCAICVRGAEEPKRIPSRRTTTSVFGVEALSAQTLVRYVSVSTVGLHEGEDSFEGVVGPETEFVHINGHPFVWALKDIFKQAPNLLAIQVSPRQAHNLKEKHKKLCQEHKVAIRYGYHRPQSAWAEDENRSSHYHAQQRFFTTLTGEQQALFKEAMKLGFKAALITSRYFCLNGEKYIPLHKLAEEFGFTQSATHVSHYVNACIAYLDPTFKASQDAQRTTGTLTRQVERVRAIVATEEAQKTYCHSLGVQQLPERLFPSRFEQFEKVLAAQRDGRIDNLDPRLRSIVIDSFGLNEQQRCQTLGEIGIKLGVTKERVRQLLERALTKLQIRSEEL